LLQRSGTRTRTPSYLAKEVVCTSGAMTKLIDRLEKARLVARKPDPEDRRGVQVKLTAQGQKRAVAAARSYRAVRKRILDRLKDTDAESIQAGLEQLLFALEVDRVSS